MTHLDTLRGRPICWCMNEACPVANTDIPYCWLDTMAPPGSCKFCFQPFLYQPSDCTFKPRKGKGKGKDNNTYEQGKGLGKSKAHNYSHNYGKGQGKKGYDTFPDTYPAKGKGGGKYDANISASFLQSLVHTMETNGSSPEAIAQLKVSYETMGNNGHKGPIPATSPIAKLKKEVKLAYAKVADLKNKNTQARQKFVKLIAECNQQTVVCSNLATEYMDMQAEYEALQQKLSDASNEKLSEADEAFNGAVQTFIAISHITEAIVDEPDKPEEPTTIPDDDAFTSNADRAAEDDKDDEDDVEDSNMPQVATKRPMPIGAENLLENLLHMQDVQATYKRRKSPRAPGDAAEDE